MFSAHGVLFMLFRVVSPTASRYAPTWDSLDTRPLPQWWADAKVGIFIHWSLFSVPSFHGEWFVYDWLSAKDPDVVSFVEKTQNPTFSYANYASRFTGELFNASDWVALFKASGARYVVPTTKHHDAFCMWPSPFSPNFNSVDVGPKLDVIGSLANATRAAGLKFGAYHSLFEFYSASSSSPYALAPSRKRAQSAIPRAHGDLLFLCARPLTPLTPSTPPPTPIPICRPVVSAGQGQQLDHKHLCHVKDPAGAVRYCRSLRA